MSTTPVGGSSNSGLNDADVIVSLLDDAAIRRQENVAKFAEIEKSLPAWPLVYDNIVLVGFGDVWSEIRKDSFKALQRMAKSIDVEIKMRIAEEVVSSSKADITWQELHGNLLCLLALFGDLGGAETAALRDDLQLHDLLMSHIGHSQMAIRECVTRCLSAFHFFESKHFMQNLLVRLDQILDSAIAQQSEHEVNGLLTIVFTFVDTTINFFDVSFCLQSLHIVSRYLRSSSSIVRQLAAQTMLSSYKRSEQFTAPVGISYVVRNEVHSVIREALMISRPSSSNADPHWELLEVSLIIYEEILSSSILDYLQLLSNNSVLPAEQQSTTNSNISLFALVSLLISTLPEYFYHIRFEIRRMISQLLPTFVRFIVLVYSDINQSIPLEPYSPHAECCRLEYVASCEISPHIVAASMNALLSSEIAKTLQLILEVLSPYMRPIKAELAPSEAEKLRWKCFYKYISPNADDSNDFGQLIQPAILSELNQWCNWGLYINGRLTEIQSRKEFFSRLKNLAFSTNISGQNTLYALLDRGTQFLLAFPVLLPNQLRHVVGYNHFHITSCDYAEALVLKLTVLSLYHYRLTLNDNRNYNNVAINDFLISSGLKEISQCLRVIHESESSDVCSPSKKSRSSADRMAIPSVDIDNTIVKQLFMEEDSSAATSSESTHESANTIREDELLLPFLRDPSANPLRLLSFLSSISDLSLSLTSDIGDSDRLVSGHLANRYVCEAVASPLSCLLLLLPLNSCLVAVDRSLWISYLFVIAGWLSSSNTSKIWLDGMQYGTKSLYKSFWLTAVNYSMSVESVSEAVDLSEYAAVGSIVSQILDVASYNSFVHNPLMAFMLQGILVLVKSLACHCNNEQDDLLISKMMLGDSSVELLGSWLNALHSRYDQTAAVVSTFEENEEDEFSDWDEDSETNDFESPNDSNQNNEDILESIASIKAIIAFFR